MTIQSKLQLNLVDPSSEKHTRSDKILGGRLTICTPKGLQGVYRILMESAFEVNAGHILTLSCPTPIPALALALLKSESQITCFHHDLYHVDLCRRLAEKHGLESVNHQCDSTLARVPVSPDLILAYNSRNCEKGMTLEWFRQALLYLAPGGKLLVATPNKTDRWIRKQIMTIFGNVSIMVHSRHGIVYSVKKRGLPEQDRAVLESRIFYIRQVEVNHYSRNLVFDTCYGVFNAETLDEGSRALLETMKPNGPVKRLLDLGCGWGGMAVFAAQIHEVERLTLVESNARALSMARRNIERHDLLSQTRFRHEAKCESILECPDEDGCYDAVIANLPYATDHRVAGLFVRASHKALKTGGQAWLVSKPDPCLEDRISDVYGQVNVMNRRGYSVYTAVKS
jgi:16S rRNA G1207 methylase RsmC